MIEQEAKETPFYCCVCLGDGWYWEDYGGCGNPECCGSPVKKKCYNCENDYEEDEDDCSRS
jgi:hypothetical protein